MTLPQFPQFIEIDLTFRSIVQDYFSGYPLEASEYTFTNLFAFMDLYNFRLSQLKDNLIIMKGAEPVSLFCPVGNTEITNVMDGLFEYLKKYPGEPCIERTPERFVTAHLIGNEKFVAEEDRNHFDYVYDIRELIELKGRRFHDKKNKVNKFRSSHQYEYSALTSGMIGECLEYEKYWCEERECEKYYGLHKERCAILEMLNNFEPLNLKGGIIRVDNKIVALTLGERFLPDTFVIHIEKASSGIPGLYQAINQEFLMHEANDCKFVNREQDLGIEGLRNSKMSYNPVKFIKKYRVREKRGIE